MRPTKRVGRQPRTRVAQSRTASIAIPGGGDGATKIVSKITRPRKHERGERYEHERDRDHADDVRAGPEASDEPRIGDDERPCRVADVPDVHGRMHDEELREQEFAFALRVQNQPPHPSNDGGAGCRLSPSVDTVSAGRIGRHERRRARWRVAPATLP